MGDQLSDDTATELRTLFLTQAIKHRWRLVAVCTVLGLLAGLAYVFTTGQDRTATAQVLVNPIVGNPYSDQSTTNNSSVIVAMETEAGVVGSAAVTATVNQQLGLNLEPYPSGLVTVVPDNTQIVNITYTDASGSRAQSVAQTYAQDYLARRTALARATQAARLATLTAVATRTSALLVAAAKAASGATPDPEAAARVQVYSSQLASVQTEIGDTQALDTTAGTVLTPATLAPGESSLKQAALVVGAILAGLVVGLILAAWRERRSDIVYADDAPSPPKLPVLGRFGSDGTGASAADQLRLVRVGVQLAIPAPAVVAITPLSADEPIAKLGLGLATSLIGAGHAAVLVDARVNPGADTPRLPGGHGLSDAIAAPADRELHVQDFNGVPALTAGTDPLGARDRYAGPALGTVLGRLRGAYDYLIVLTAPGDDAVGIAVAAATDAVLVTITERQSRYGDIGRLAALLERGGSQALGTLLLRPRPAPPAPKPVAAKPPAAAKPSAEAKPKPAGRPAPSTGRPSASRTERPVRDRAEPPKRPEATRPKTPPTRSDPAARPNDSASSTSAPPSSADGASPRPSGPGRRPTPRGRR